MLTRRRRNQKREKQKCPEVGNKKKQHYLTYGYENGKKMRLEEKMERKYG